jgi:predicted Zn finger-like uncharacterized protein
MSLATRCINCSTVFRVVQDQLLVSEGWVRCGRCREVFNAIENMFDLKKDTPSSLLPLATPPTGFDTLRDTPPAAPAGGAARADRRAVPRPSPPSPPSQDAFVSSTNTRPPRVDHPGFAASASSQEPVRVSLWPSSEQTDVGHGAGLAAGDAAGDSATGNSKQARARSKALRDDVDFQMSESTLDVPVDVSSVGHLPSDEAVDQLLIGNSRDTQFEPYPQAPDFLVRARLASRWQQPKVRLALRLAAILLSITLGLQVVMHARDTLAARWPVAESMLQALCAPLNCRVEAPRRLQALKVESAALTESGTAGTYRLAVALRNVDDIVVRMPALDLRILNARGEPVARRIITASELGMTSLVIEAGGDANLQGLLRLSLPNVAGYNVEAFYP